MYAISLTSIPPRFHRLTPVLESLLAQDPRPAQVILCLPKFFRRFPGTFEPPELPEGVDLLWSDTDFGPATKALPAVRYLLGKYESLIYCDDDWLASPRWAARLLAARRPRQATTGTGFGVERLGRVSQTRGDYVDIAQGFSGVAIDPSWLIDTEVEPPDAAWSVDDIWLSGHMARQGIAIKAVPAARHLQHLAYDDGHTLQDTEINGISRDTANRACADLLTQKYGIWPPAR